MIAQGRADMSLDEKLAEKIAVERALGDGRIICGRCQCTLWDYADKCKAALGERCPGFDRIESAAQERFRHDPI